MNSYLEILQDKAKKIGADIEMCGYDKECITNIIAKKVRSNLENEELSVIKEKAIIIEANILGDNQDKSSILDAIEEKIKEVLEKENELFSSIELQKDFMPLDLG
jgi:hypothetical protein